MKNIFITLFFLFCSSCVHFNESQLHNAPDGKLIRCQSTDIIGAHGWAGWTTETCYYLCHGNKWCKIKDDDQTIEKINKKYNVEE